MVRMEAVLLQEIDDQLPRDATPQFGLPVLCEQPLVGSGIQKIRSGFPVFPEMRSVTVIEPERLSMRAPIAYRGRPCSAHLGGASNRHSGNSADPDGDVHRCLVLEVIALDVLPDL